MDIIKQKIREQLEKEQVRTKYLTESLKPLSDISDEGFFIQSYIQIADNLMEEGYTLEEIEPLDIVALAVAPVPPPPEIVTSGMSSYPEP